MKNLNILLTTILLAACSKTETTSAPPPPQAITEQAKGYYCTMNLNEHYGGKAQIFVQSQPDKPDWLHAPSWRAQRHYRHLCNRHEQSNRLAQPQCRQRMD